ncbi:MAG: glycine cleavage system protein GcvH [Planctomycetes bacterium]|nr:glycine cleavage system protein GcvH [Planctomycetota bacterium]
MGEKVVPDGLYYTKEHEWLRVEGDVATIGVTDHAQQELGDITYVELPDPGTVFHQFEEAGVVESVKAASDVYCPVSGEVTKVNMELADDPVVVNAEPYDGGWLFKVRIEDPTELDNLMGAEEYKLLLGEEE